MLGKSDFSLKASSSLALVKNDRQNIMAKTLDICRGLADFFFFFERYIQMHLACTLNGITRSLYSVHGL
jgi:hypothetical protein